MNEILSVDDIRVPVCEYGERYGAKRIYLFGSYAKGSATSDSDIDLRIDEGDGCGLIALSGLRLAISEYLRKKVDLLTSDSLSPEFLSQIQPEEVLLYAEN